MQTLRGSGNTFSTSRKRWRSFTAPNRNVLQRARLKKFCPTLSKAEARALCNQAVAGDLEFSNRKKF